MTHPPEPEYVDEDHQRIAEFAADFLDDDEAESFVDHLMERRGYKRTHRWQAPSGDPRDGGGADPDPDPGGGRGGRGGRQGSSGGRRRQPYFKR